MTELYILILIITFIKSIILGRKHSFSIQNYLFVYFGVSSFLESYGYYKTQIKEFDFAYLFNYYTLFIILFFFQFYYSLLDKYLKRIILIILIISLIFILFFTNPFTSKYDNFLGLIASLGFIFYCLLWFYQKIKYVNQKRITDDPYFWITTGLLFWSMFFIFRVTPMYFFANSDEGFSENIKTLQNFINFITYSLFYVGLEKFEKIKPNEPTS